MQIGSPEWQGEPIVSIIDKPSRWRLSLIQGLPSKAFWSPILPLPLPLSSQLIIIQSDPSSSYHKSISATFVWVRMFMLCVHTLSQPIPGLLFLRLESPPHNPNKERYNIIADCAACRLCCNGETGGLEPNNCYSSNCNTRRLCEVLARLVKQGLIAVGSDQNFPFKDSMFSRIALPTRDTSLVLMKKFSQKREPLETRSCLGFLIFRESFSLTIVQS